ncbi:unnamed protein product [Heterobilharzia americana]|nr:unnamed protein product [Heterobilharzia americana]
MDANNALKLGRLFRVPYGGEGVDFVDQLNYQFTSGIIVMFIVLIGFRQYVGKPLHCWYRRNSLVHGKTMQRIFVGCKIPTFYYLTKLYQRTILKCSGGTPPTTRITLIFLVVRICFIANNVGQIYVMKHFIGTNDTLFGLHVFQELLVGSEWEVSGLFPRVTYCDVKVRKLGQLKPASYTLQCVLPVNYFIEKVYVFLWFWYIILASFTVFNTFIWITKLCIPYRRVHLSANI